jgi:amidase
VAATHSAAERNAYVVHKTLNEGARIVGLTKLDQLAYSLIGNVGEGPAPINPFRPAAYCGGSSSGTASAVAGGEATVGIGTDTAGSIRVPAAVCGLYGLRPTHGAIDADGALPLAASFDVVSVCAATLGPMQRMYDRLARTAVPTEFWRVLVPDSPLGSAGEHEVLTSFAASLAKKLATAVTAVGVGEFVSADAGDLLARVQGREIWATHGDWLEVNGRHLADDVRTRVERCKVLSRDGEDSRHADVSRRQDYSMRLTELLAKDAVLVLPAMPDARPDRSWTQDRLAAYRSACVQLTAASSLSGLPQLVVRLPASLARDEVTALGLIGPRGSDRELMSLAAELESAR